MTRTTAIRWVLFGSVLCLLTAVLPAATPTVTITNKGGTPFACTKPNPSGPATVLSTHSEQHKAEEACINRSLADSQVYVVTESRLLEVRTTGATTTPPTPVPVDCKVSAWSEPPTVTMTSACSAQGKQTVEYTHTRTVTQQPANGGAACPVLSEKWTEEKTCTPPVVTPPSGDLLPRNPGHTTARVQNTSRPILSGDGTGSFRVSVGFSHAIADDPIVFPGQPGKSHCHAFFGNSSTNADSTQATLSAANASTSFGGILNRTSYWVPCGYDAAGKIVKPNSELTYYKSGYAGTPPNTIQPPPNGLRFVFGKSPNSTAPHPPGYSTDYGHTWFECYAPNGNRVGSRAQTIPVGCTGWILQSINAPNCWDGINLDSIDHRSHMAYSADKNPQGCNGAHPVAIPTISFNVYWPTTLVKLASDMYAGTPGTWGYSAHADIWLNWDEATKQSWMNNCVRAAKDCQGDIIAPGRELY